jgi:imidazolonepropionase-like amidohydrolase
MAIRPRAGAAPAVRVRGGRWLDVVTGESTPKDLLLADGRIAADDGRAAITVDADGAWVLPGLMDCHAHPGEAFYAPGAATYFESVAERTVRAGENLRDAAAVGITGVRCVDEAEGIDFAWRAAFASGSSSGPRVLAAGRAIRTTGGHGTAHPRVPVNMGDMHVADGPTLMARAVREQVERGADWIKIMLTGGLMSEHETVDGMQLSEEELDAVLMTATQRGIPVTAHCGGAEAAKRFARAGGRCIEHGYALDEEAAAILAEQGTWLVPTIGVTHDDGFLEHGDGWPEFSLSRARATRERHAESLAMCQAAGVRIAVGADLNPIADRLHRELELLESAGMSRLDVLRAATVGARELNGLGATSTPDPGVIADLIVVDADPLEDPAALRRPRSVILAGRVLEPLSP